MIPHRGWTNVLLMDARVFPASATFGVMGKPIEALRLELFGAYVTWSRFTDFDITIEDIAEKTPSFSGAELAALCNEAAIRAARRGDQRVTQADFAAATTSYVASRRPGLGVDALLGKMLRG